MVEPPVDVLPPSSQPPARRLLGRLALTAGLILTALILIVTVGITRPGGEPASAPAPAPVPPPDPRPRPGAAVPHPALAAPEDRPKVSDQVELEAWAAKVSAQSQVPARVLAAYGRAEMWMRSQKAGCHLTWPTLAGIGRVEAQRGNFGAVPIGADGRAAPPITGPVLDGSPGVPSVPDTDGGRLDGDPHWDRAVGPLQILPTTWERWAARADGDGARPDPQNIDDSAFTAARILCGSGDDLSTPAGWWKALFAYNGATAYGQDVFIAADAFASASPP
ncbi:murein transglycosylase [Amycolatopsis sp. NPDC059657]|uniref:murein transglycosylase n=1 Tax=Amycolatopsis sp. NPDC059657 TaxID=3346899 RepID=UPI00366AD6A7